LYSGIDFDQILAREAQLMINRAPGFEPVHGDLRRWRGKVKTGRNQWVEVEIIVPDGYPHVPPEVKVLTPIKHPYVDSQGKLHLPILESWRPHYHLHHVVNTIKGLFVRYPPEEVTPPKPPLHKEPSKDIATLQKKIQILEEQIKALQRELHEKDVEIVRLKNMIHYNIPDRTMATSSRDILDEALPEDPEERLRIELECELQAIEDMLHILEEKFEAGEIPPEDYHKLYTNYLKRMYKVKKLLEGMKKGEGSEKSR